MSVDLISFLSSFEDIITSSELLLDKYETEFEVEPLILVENRTGQFISSGKEICHFWNFLSEKYPHLKRKMGIVLDVQQLHTVTKQNFARELREIPLEALKGFHVHYKHRVPRLSNEIPWKQVFDRIAMKKSTIINPEIHHKNKVKDAIRFCGKMLHAS